MSYVSTGPAPGDQEDSPEYLSMCAKASTHPEGDQRTETPEKRRERDSNEQLRSSTTSHDCNSHYPHLSSSSGKPRLKMEKARESLGHEPSVMNPKHLRTEVSKPFPWRTCSTMASKKKQLDDQAHAMELHRRKFQATLDSLIEEFESGALAARIHIPQIQEKNLNVRLNFRVHYDTKSTNKLLAVTGNLQELGAWEGFVLLQKVENEFWINSITVSRGSLVEWKFVVVEDGKIQRWEEGRNRQLLVPRKGEEVQLLCTWACQ